MKGVSWDMLQGVMGWNWIGEANTGDAGENNCMKLRQKNTSVTSGYVSLLFVQECPFEAIICE